MSGTAPFGLRRVDGRLVPDPGALPLVREIVETFIATGGRVKSTAAALNRKGYRTRQGATWSDTAVKRALRVVDHEGVVPEDLRERCLAFLEARTRSAGTPTRQSVHSLGSAVRCACGGRLSVVGKGSAAKFVCRGCKTKIPVETLERCFAESLSSIEVTPDEVLGALVDNPRVAELRRRLGTESISVGLIWPALTPAEKRLLVDVAVLRVLVENDQIVVVFGLKSGSAEDSAGFPLEVLPSPYGSEPPEDRATREGNANVSVGAVRNRKHAGSVADAASTDALLVTVDGAAALLRTTRKAIYAMVERGQLPGAVRVGRRLLFRRDELLDSVSGSRAPSPKEVRR